MLELLGFYGFQTILLENKLDNVLNEVLKQEPDLVILDIDHCSIQSLKHDFFEYLKEPPGLIGISQSTDQAYTCIKLGITDYLLKPLAEVEIRKALLKYKKTFQNDQENICFKNYSDYYFLNPDEILYLKADSNTTDIILASGKTVPAFKTLKTFEKNLPKNFLRIHNSYIINTDKILRINFGKSQVYLAQHAENLAVPFSKAHRDKLKYLRMVLAEQDIIF